MPEFNPDRPLIVCVDDNLDQLDGYEALLETRGKIITFSSPKEALAKLPLLSPRMFVFDVEMPGMTGFDLATRVRIDMPRHDGAPILFVSGLDRKLNLENAIRAGGDDFLSKPVPTPSLRATVDALLSLSGIADPYERHQRYLKIRPA
ncbi:MAG: PleD family two-component system response regulator [Planctomycetota bacterium]